MEALNKIAVAFEQGGTWMWVILILTAAAVAIAMERCAALYLKRKMGEREFARSFESLIRKGELQEVLTQAQKNPQHPLSGAVIAGTEAALALGGRDEIRGKMDEVLLFEAGKIEKRTGFLAMLANVGTLTGLLGTITGMIQSFAAVSFANPMEKATLLSAGISEAMNTTAFGLIMAIPTLIVYAILANRGNALLEDLNQGALRVYNWLSYAYEPIPIRQAQARREQTRTKEVEA